MTEGEETIKKVSKSAFYVIFRRLHDEDLHLGEEASKVRVRKMVSSPYWKTDDSMKRGRPS